MTAGYERNRPSSLYNQSLVEYYGKPPLLCVQMNDVTASRNLDETALRVISRSAVWQHVGGHFCGDKLQCAGKVQIRLPSNVQLLNAAERREKVDWISVTTASSEIQGEIYPVLWMRWSRRSTRSPADKRSRDNAGKAIPYK